MSDVSPIRNGLTQGDALSPLLLEGSSKPGWLEIIWYTAFSIG